MLFVGLTGGIASGKSVVAAVFVRHGAHLHDADRESRRLMEPGTSAHEKIVARFGSAIAGLDGTIDRKSLGRIVFGDEAARRDLERILHPLILETMKAAAARSESESRSDVFVSDAALIYEAGIEAFFDKIVVAYCRPEVQVERLMARDGIGRTEAEARLRAQMDPAEKKARADYVVDTSDEWEETLARTEAVWAFLADDARRKTGRSGRR